MNLLIQVRHSFTTRMLLTCIRSKLYWNEQTTDDIFAEIARQACELFIEGFQDPQLNFMIDTEVLYF